MVIYRFFLILLSFFGSYRIKDELIIVGRIMVLLRKKIYYFFGFFGGNVLVCYFYGIIYEL